MFDETFTMAAHGPRFVQVVKVDKRGGAGNAVYDNS
jgi:hypothetical protein